MEIRDLLRRKRYPAILINSSIKDAASLIYRQKAEALYVMDHNGDFAGFFTKGMVVKAVSLEIDTGSPISELIINKNNYGYSENYRPGIGHLKHNYHPVLDDPEESGSLIMNVDQMQVFYDALQKKIKIFSAIVNLSQHLVIVCDLNEKITFFNKSALDFFRTKSSIIKDRDMSLIFSESEMKGITSEEDAYSVKKVNIGNSSFILNSYPIDYINESIGRVYIFQDITQVEKILNELDIVKELNNDLNAIVDTSSDGIVVCDGNGNITRVSRSYSEMSGIDTSEFVGKNMKELVAAGLYSSSSTLLALEKRSKSVIIQKTNSGKNMMVSAIPIINSKNEIVRVVCNSRDITELKILINQLEHSQFIIERYREELESMKKQTVNIVEGMVFNSPKMRDIVEICKRLARVDSTVLITGESGTGKELVSEMIYKYSLRKDKPFIKVNCGAIPESLLEAELFGYEDGAFTGARRGGKAGFFEMADSGTLFLDEIGELPYNIQSKFLRILQQMEFTRIGGEKLRKVDVRIIVATNKDLHSMVLEKSFREDLYYRLSVVPVEVPPLRERTDDIGILVNHFVKIFNKHYSVDRRIAPEVVSILEKYQWPGNVRELKNLIERLLVLSLNDLITKNDLPEKYCEDIRNGNCLMFDSIIPIKVAVESVEKKLIKMAYEKYNTTREMGVSLGIDASTVVRKAAKYGISS